MKIAIIGTGAIGSTLAFHLAKAGHDVTAIARGARLAQLAGDNAIVKVDGDRAPVQASPGLDATTPWDLVLVTVLAPQVDAVLPALQASSAKKVMFLFNTFEPLDRLRAAVGAERFAFGFPAIFATLTDGKLKSEIFKRGQITTVTDADTARLLTEAGIATVVHDDLHSWLRTHAVFVAPLMAAGTVAHARGKGISWREARGYAEAMKAGFGIVRSLGNAITPSAMRTTSRMPRAILTFILWVMTRTKTLRELGGFGPNEARMLIDSISATAPEASAALVAIRP